MFRVAYVNGRYLPHDRAAVHIEDRGYQFADAVYEVCEIYDGRLLDERRHMERLERSLRELRIPMPVVLAIKRVAPERQIMGARVKESWRRRASSRAG